MTVTATGFLHPGAMGATIAAACGGDTRWVSADRSEATRQRAGTAGLVDAGSLAALVEQCEVIVSVCPPDRAIDVARTVADVGFAGIFVDANAIAPASTQRIAELFERYVDGGIVGPPAEQPGSTRMYLSGAEAAQVASRWDGSVLDVRAIEGGIGAASAVKMLFAAWGKHNAALMLAICAVAESFGVTDAIRDEWELSRPDFVERSAAAATRTAPKAWRFEGEMHEIAATFDAAGMPPEFHRGAAEIFRRMAGFKTSEQPPDLDEVVAALLR